MSAQTITQGVTQQDYNALMGLYNSCGGQYWDSEHNGDPTNNWSTDNLVENWYGVTVENQRVTKIILNNNGLYAELPTEIGNLTALKVLNLKNNGIHGSIPNQIASINTLQILDLSYNHFDHVIPTNIFALPQIQSLILNDNHIPGPLNIASPISGTSLNTIRLENNCITGAIPSQIGSLISLTTINLSNNKIEGGIPSSIGNLDNLTTLEVQYNLLDQPIPNTLNNPFTVFNCSYNKLGFEDLIPFDAQNKSWLIYAPQKEFGEVASVQLASGGTTSLQLNGFNTNYSGNTYDWYFHQMPNGNWGLKAQQQQSTFTVTNVTTANRGIYRCIIKNPLLPQLELWSKPVHICVNFNSTSAGISAQHFDILARLFLSTNGIAWQSHLSHGYQGWIDKTNWLSDSRYYNWYGFIPPSSAYLYECIILDNNNLVGEIPDDIGLLKGLGLEKQIDFRVYNNIGISGVLPSTIKHLWRFSASNTNLSGKIDDSNWYNFLSEHYRISRLTIGGTNIHGNNLALKMYTPPEWGGGVVKFIAPNCNFYGEINATNLADRLINFNIRNNDMYGDIPDVFFEEGRLLSIFDISNNHFDGSFPSVINNSTLHNLLINNNNYTGDFKVSLNCPSMRQLNIFDNFFDGSLDVSQYNQVSSDYFALNFNNNHFHDVVSNPNSSTVIYHVSGLNNKLTFEDILSFANPSFVENLNMHPQQKIGEEIDKYAIPQGSIEIKLDIDEEVTTNQYFLCKFHSDGTPPGHEYTNLTAGPFNTNIIKLDNITEDMAGVYQIYVTNSAVPSTKLVSEKINLIVSDCAIPQSEIDVLYEIRDINGGTSTQEWDVDINPIVCDWPGIETDGLHITGIKLPNDGLTGILPESICDLPYLTEVDFSGNELEAPYPTCWCALHANENYDVEIEKVSGDYICSDEPLILRANVEGGKGEPLLYYWYKNDVSIFLNFHNTADWSIVAGDVFAEYRVEIKTLSDICVGGATYNHTEDQVHQLPQITADDIVYTSCLTSADAVNQFRINNTASITDNIVLCEVYKISNNELVGSPVKIVNDPVNNQNYAIENLDIGSYRIVITSESGCKDFKDFVVLNGAPTINNVCTTNLPCNITQGQNANVSVKFKINRKRKNGDNVFTYTISENGSVIVSPVTANYDQDIISPDFTYVHGSSYRISIIDSDEVDCGIEYNLVFYPLEVHLVNMQSEYFRCYPNQEINVSGAIYTNKNSCSNTSWNYNCNLYKIEEDGTQVHMEQLLPGNGAVIQTEALENGSYMIDAQLTDTYYGTCVAEQFFTVQSNELQIDVDVVNEQCPGTENGIATAKVKGGIAPYQYYWYQGGTLIARGSQAKGLAPGSDYELKVKDSRPCHLDGAGIPFSVEPAEEMGDITVILPDTESADCSIIAEISEANNNERYTFAWNRLSNEVIQGIEYNADGSPKIDDQGDDDPINDIILSREYIEELDATVYTDIAYGDGTSASSETTLEVIIPRPDYQYYIVVTDERGCKKTTRYQEGGDPYPGIVERPEVEREYSIFYCWKSHKEHEVINPPVININQSATLAASSIKNKFDEAHLECAAIAGMKSQAKYDQLCTSLDSLEDELAISYANQAQHFTLYYYDRAGNLSKTVPPAGVNPCTNINDWTGHRMVTNYEYNSLGQVVKQTTPDAGTSKFLYNIAGQLRCSQNAKQAHDGTISYTKYDELGRIREVGVANLSDLGYSNWDALIAANKLIFVNDMTVSLDNKFPASSSIGLSQQTKNYYSDNSVIEYNGNEQRYLLNRISHTEYTNKNGFVVTTYFSYDPHGNVEWLVQDIPGLGQKGISYEYDLISGNVTQVVYNENQVDQFFHRYQYDADNRIVSVETSTNGIVWDQDAIYDYYKHGPLQRTELGHNKVQGLDYTYTLQGWLKAINHPTLSPANDPGHDGLGTGVRDVFGMILTFYDGDFTNNNSVFDSEYAQNNHIINEVKPINGKNLYNGNIAAWTHNVAQANADGAISYDHLNGQQFVYDQLNRIKQSQFNEYSDDWNSVNKNNSSYTYDGNGNLLTLSRNGDDGGIMDQLTYNYENNTNKLTHVADAITDVNAYSDDVENQSFDNYEYDEIGNLISDDIEGVLIDWNVNGKVNSITKTDGSQIDFCYDASGNRVLKHVTLPGGLFTKTYYVRDVEGNILSSYEETKVNQLNENTPPPPPGTEYFKVMLKEQPIYGSSRLGMRLADNIAVNLITTNNRGQIYYDYPLIQQTDVYSRNIGNKQYELSDHLGNVRAVVTDRLIGVSSVIEPTATLGDTWQRSMTSMINSDGISLNTANSYEGISLGATAIDATNYTLDLDVDKTLYANNLEYAVYQNNAKIAGAKITSSGTINIPVTYNNLEESLNLRLVHYGATAPASGGLQPQLIASNSYYPFGMLLSSSQESDKYRFGFNGKEKDDKGEWGLTHYDYGFRIYNPGIAKFLSVDPLTKSYPMLTPYQFASNSPIAGIDMDGLEFAPSISGQGSCQAQMQMLDESDVIQTFVKGTWKNIKSFAQGISHNMLYRSSGMPGTDILSFLRAPVEAKESIVNTIDLYRTFPEMNAEDKVAATEMGLITLGSLYYGGKQFLKPSIMFKFNLIKPTTLKLNLRGSASKFKGKIGVYVHKFEDGSLYIGKATPLSTRPKQSLRELLDESGKYKGTARNKKYKETDFYEYDETLYENLDHMEGDFLNNKFKFRQKGGENLLNKKQTDNWNKYKDK
ncbi:MAG: hypothetical protein N4A74_19045 [Carboxylicivirga sp.]|jgi:RHS repeat-associated protein|nr:hypothetical protein [Carboxylicivirga sp.]